MRIEYFNDYHSMSMAGAALIISELKRKKDIFLCTATGNSPKGIYRELVRINKNPNRLFSQVRILKLDEWLGLETNSEGTCERYLKEHLLLPLNIPGDRFVTFGKEEASTLSFERITSILYKSPVDICILGMGKNGHLGFNEPGSGPDSTIRKVKLDSQSQKYILINGVKRRLDTGITLGIREILMAKKIILLITGSGKTAAKEKFLEAKINSHWPVTYLWKHNNVVCLINNG